MIRRPTLLFYCQHAMGMGHLVRSLALADALSQSFRVVLLNGGELPACLSLPQSIEIVNLPPLRLAEGQLVSCDNRYSVTQAQDERLDRILSSFRWLRPEVLLIELYPFGRKKFEFELLPLLEAAKTQSRFAPLIVCSLRDILVSSRSDQQKHEQRVVSTANRWFDAILVHSDLGFARLEESFDPRTRLIPSVHHTGFVVGNRQKLPRDRSRNGPIVVSAGGGHYGCQLLSSAIEAHALLSETESLTMKVVAGPFLPEAQWKDLCVAADGRRGVTLVRSVPDLYSELCQARASISQCGYNTAMEIVQAQVPALVVPFADRGEDEQLKRARRLEALGAMRVLEQKEMRPERMAEEIRNLINFQPQTARLNFDGARWSTEILYDLLERRQVMQGSHAVEELVRCLA
ncbi:MAG TPA: glycosyltransferase [Pyrinomonadaceae bacterium]